ncbi:DUF4145 domain-containing protein [Nocardia sp. CWNU-33]|uniref:DUF4145 domain-containing protein n=1 Tax=Nocardia sp. CWNU-33 TaxID=3392117 RepID=UPI00398F37C2
MRHGLKALQESGRIDGRLVDWATHLRNIGNEGAHDLDFEPDREEALDSQALLEGVVRYVYIDQARYEDAKRRWEYRRLPALDITYEISQYQNGCLVLTIVKPPEAVDQQNDDGKRAIGGWVHHKIGFTRPGEVPGIESRIWASCRTTTTVWLQVRNFRVGSWNKVLVDTPLGHCNADVHNDEPPF